RSQCAEVQGHRGWAKAQLDVVQAEGGAFVIYAIPRQQLAQHHEIVAHQRYRRPAGYAVTASIRLTIDAAAADAEDESTPAQLAQGAGRDGEGRGRPDRDRHDRDAGDEAAVHELGGGRRPLRAGLERVS